jgi:hypothetical protein
MEQQDLTNHRRTRGGVGAPRAIGARAWWGPGRRRPWPGWYARGPQPGWLACQPGADLRQAARVAHLPCRQRLRRGLVCTARPGLCARE